MISRIVFRLDSAYPSADDRAAIEEYLATADARRAALEEVRRAATVVPEKVVAGLRQRYPDFARMRSTGFDKIQRDIGMLTCMGGNAMFLGEHETLDHEFTIWFQTILKGAHVSPQMMRDGFDLWHEHLKSNLSTAAWGLLRPHVEHIADVLTDLPVPARDETGRRTELAAAV